LGKRLSCPWVCVIIVILLGIKSSFIYLKLEESLFTVRHYRIKTTPCVEKKDLLEPDYRTVTLGFRVKRLG
jgi:hypothetical protein